MNDFINFGDVYFRCCSCGKIVNVGNFDFRLCLNCNSKLILKEALILLEKYLKNINQEEENND